MKKLFLLMALMGAVVTSVQAKEQASLPEEWQDCLVLPNIDEFLAQHPYPEIGTEEWDQDSIKYFLYKEPKLKNGVVNYDSIWAHLNEQYYFVLHRLAADSVMNAPFIAITFKNNNTAVDTHSANNTDFPAMNELEALCESMKSANTPSGKRVRQRPFCYFNGWYNGNHYSRNSSGNRDSYPSGHGYFRGLFGKCLEIIDPNHNEAIQAMMDEWLFCRLQKGAHWYTDIAAGQQLGELAFDSAMTCEAFRDLVYAAKEELRIYRNEPENPTAVETVSGNTLSKPQKVLREGQLVILRKGKTYTAQGQIMP